MNKTRTIDELTEYAARHITDAEALEMMGDECAELELACVRAARALRGDGAPPGALLDALEKVTAKVNDMFNMMCVVHEKFPQVREVPTLRVGKMQMLHDRLEGDRR